MDFESIPFAATLAATALTLGLTGTATAAEFARIHGATDCHPYLESSDIVRNSTGLRISNSNGNTAVWVRCSVPSNSLLSHTQMSQVKIAGKMSSHAQARIFKTCSTNKWGTYYCGADEVRFGNGVTGIDFTELVYPTGEWGSGAVYPMVVIKLYKGDEIRGITYEE